MQRGGGRTETYTGIPVQYHPAMYMRTPIFDAAYTENEKTTKPRPKSMIRCATYQTRSGTAIPGATTNKQSCVIGMMGGIASGNSKQTVVW